MGHERAVVLPAEHLALARGHDEKAPVRHPVDADRLKRGEAELGHHLAATVEVDRDDLSAPPVGEPEPAVGSPARRLAEHDPGHERSHTHYRRASLVLHRPFDHDAATCRWSSPG